MERERLEVIRRAAGGYSHNGKDATPEKLLAKILVALADTNAGASTNGTTPVRPNAPSSVANTDPLSIVSVLAQAELTRRAATQPPSPTITNTSNANQGKSAGEMVIKTLGLLTGVGPVVTGLLSFFGGKGGDGSEVTPLPLYTLPPSVSVNAGLHSDRSISGVDYGAGGHIRAIPPDRQAPAPTIQVNVQAMDSRSFLDHSSEIAAAVRRAMLQSNSLNDVISEL